MTPTAVEASRSRGRDARPRKPLYAKLKPGPGRSTEEVFVNQRARLHGAMIELCAERGYEGVTVRSLARLAGVSTRTFYRHFPNAEECFASAYDSLMQYSLQRAYAAQSGTMDWEEAIRASLQSLLDDLARYPKAARLVLIEAFVVGSTMQARMREATAGFERLLTDSFAGASEEVAAPRHIARGIVAGVMRVARTRLLTSTSAELAGLARDLGDWMLSLPGDYATALRMPDRQPFRSLAQLNGNGDRDDLSADILGNVGSEEGRILTAVLKLSATIGFSKLTVPRIRAMAGVSRRSFDARFDDVEECFLEAIEAIVASATARAEQEANEARDWETGVYRGIRTLCTEVARNPVLARLAFVDIFAPGRAGLRRRERLVSLGSNRLRAGLPPAERPSDMLAEASIAAAWRVANADIETGRARELPRLAPLLSYLVLAPAIGSPAATEVIQAENMACR